MARQSPHIDEKLPLYIIALRIVFTKKCRNRIASLANHTKKHFEHAYTVAEGKLKIDVACFNLQTPKSVVSVSDVKIMLVTGRMHAVSHVARDKFLHLGRAHEDFCYGRVLVGFF